MERLEAAMAKARAVRDAIPARKPVDDFGRTSNAQQGQSEPIGDWLSLPTFEITPKLGRRKRISAILGTEFSTPYDILRSRVTRQMAENKWTRLAVTSPTTKCGKSTISLNLALSLARNGEIKVILMDFDMRRPALANMLDLRHAPDISGLLRPEARLGDYALRRGSNLAVCANSGPVLRSAELLAGSATTEALDRIESIWKPDIIIFDTPPMQGNDDNLGFFSQIDCALIVAAAGSSTLAQIDRCEQEVANLTNVLGVVLNKCSYFGGMTGHDQSYY